MAGAEFVDVDDELVASPSNSWCVRDEVDEAVLLGFSGELGVVRSNVNVEVFLVLPWLRCGGEKQGRGGERRRKARARVSAGASLLVLTRGELLYGGESSGSRRDRRWQEDSLSPPHLCPLPTEPAMVAAEA